MVIVRNACFIRLERKVRRMKLVQEIKRNELLGSSWGIYELNTNEKKKYGNNYALSQGVFSEYAIKEFGADDLLSNLKDFAYEGFFETQKEAYMQVKLVEMKSKIERMELTMKNILKLQTPEW
mgnify:FL=1|jgi:hypothetical protein